MVADIDDTGHSRRRRTRSAAAAVAMLVLAACGGSADDDASQGVGPTDPSAGTTVESPLPAPGLVGPDDVGALTAAGVTVIDVRTPAEFDEGHLSGATLVDFYEPDFADQIAALDRDGEYLVYCRSGNRSGQAVALMGELGFETVFDLDGGVLAYDAAGLPLER